MSLDCGAGHPRGVRVSSEMINRPSQISSTKTRSNTALETLSEAWRRT